MKQEFNIDDIVTFRAYEDQQIKAKVKQVIPPKQGMFNTDKFSYKLTGISGSLVTETTGRSIVESKHFKCPIKHPFKF